MKHFVYAEDLASALIGPFETYEEAEAHIAFCEARGDGAEAHVINEVEAAFERPTIGMELTPEDDRNYVPSKMSRRYNES